MQYVTIKQESEISFLVNAIPLKNKNKTVVQKIPHPLGSDVLRFDNLEDAKEAITRAGFSYILPNGEKSHKTIKHPKINPQNDNYETVVYSAILDKVNSSNSSVAAAAILALCEFPTEQTFDILFSKIGEDNDLIRKNAISGICRYTNILKDRIINSLNSPNWVERNSALTCIQNAAQDNSTDLEQFIIPLTEICSDNNTIVQSNALLTLAKTYQNFRKNRN